MGRVGGLHLLTFPYRHRKPAFDFLLLSVGAERLSRGWAEGRSRSPLDLSGTTVGPDSTSDGSGWRGRKDSCSSLVFQRLGNMEQQRVEWKEPGADARRPAT